MASATGLDHMNGMSVVVWDNTAGTSLDNADGTIATFTVSGGAITVPASVIGHSLTIGLPYTALFQSTKLAYAAQLGTALGMRKRVPDLGFILHCTHARGLWFGPDFDHLDGMPTVEDGAVVDPNSIWDEYDKGPIPFPGGWNPDSRVCLQAQAPRPCTVMAAIVNVDTVDQT